jgi:hypothetical protein
MESPTARIKRLNKLIYTPLFTQIYYMRKLKKSRLKMSRPFDSFAFLGYYGNIDSTDFAAILRVCFSIERNLLTFLKRLESLCVDC